jgi:hypothetical protein
MSPSNLDTMSSIINTGLSRLCDEDEIALVGSALPPIPAPIPSITSESGVKSSLIDSGNLDLVALEQSLLIDSAVGRMHSKLGLFIGVRCARMKRIFRDRRMNLGLRLCRL